MTPYERQSSAWFCKCIRTIDALTAIGTLREQLELARMKNVFEDTIKGKNRIWTEEEAQELKQYIHQQWNRRK